MGATFLKLFVLMAWLGSTAWLVRYEAFPHWFDDTLHGYRDLANDLPAMRDTWMKVISNGQHVGYLNSAIEMEDVDGKEALLMTTQLVLKIEFQGRRETLRFTNEVRLNSKHELASSTSGFSFSQFDGDLTLTPISGDEFQLAIELNDLKFARTVKVPQEAVISSPLMDQSLRGIKPGQVLRIRTLDPFSMAGELQTVELHGLSSKDKILPGESHTLEVTRVEIRMGELTMLSEVDQFGRVLWQETPIGLTFSISRPEVAMKIPEGHAVNPADLFSSPFLSGLMATGTSP